jgi:hypothetical protein
MTGRWFTIIVALIFRGVHDSEKSFASDRPVMINENTPLMSGLHGGD